MDTDTHKEIAKVKLTEWEVKQLNYALAMNHAPIKYITKKEYLTINGIYPQCKI
jgi:hypothetical protein